MRMQDHTPSPSSLSPITWTESLIAAEAALQAAEYNRAETQRQYEGICGRLRQLNQAVLDHATREPGEPSDAGAALAVELAADPGLAARDDWPVALAPSDLPAQMAAWRARGQVLADAVENVEAERAECEGRMIGATDEIDQAFARFVRLLRAELVDRFRQEIQEIYESVWLPYLQMENISTPFARKRIHFSADGSHRIDGINSRVLTPLAGSPDCLADHAWPRRGDLDVHLDLAGLRATIRDGDPVAEAPTSRKRRTA